MGYLYRHIRLDKNEPFYIGIGKSDENFNRAYENKRRSEFWKNIVAKTDYEVEILLDNLTWEEACEKEKEFIALYGRKDLGLGTLINLTDGGEGQDNISEFTRKKMSDNAKVKHVGRKHSDETKKKMSEARKGKPHPHKGGNQSDEKKLKLKLQKIGKKLSQSQKDKISEGGKKAWIKRKAEKNNNNNE